MTKKILIAAALILVSLLLLVCCKDNAKENDPSLNETENLIYDGDSPLNIVIGADVDGKRVTEVFDAIFCIRNSPITMVNDSAEKLKHEIVIGSTEREISKEAMRLLESELSDKGKDETGYLIYSDGSSIAIVYKNDKYGAAGTRAIDRFLEGYVKEILTAEKGIAEQVSFDLVEDYLAPLDRERRESAIAEAEALVGKETAAALVSLTELYDSRLIEWLAGLYSPSICVCRGLGEEVCQNTKYCRADGAGFYFSNSGRDTAGYLPDLESTRQALGMISSSGICWMYGDSYKAALPDSVIKAIGRYTRTLQCEDGYFRHPQWASISDYDMRLNRDLSWATSLLSTAEMQPYYTTPNGVPGIGAPADSAGEMTTTLDICIPKAVSKVVSVSAYPAVLESKESFSEFLHTMDSLIRKSSYYYGSRLATYSAQIQARDRDIGTLDDPTPLMTLLIEWLNSHMNPERGTWVWDEANGGYSGQMGSYEETNGVMKISGLYSAARASWPSGLKCMRICAEVLVTDEIAYGAVDIYNAWIALDAVYTAVSSYGTPQEQAEAEAFMKNFREKEAVGALGVSKEKLKCFKCEDGSFSYWRSTSPGYSMGMPTAVPGSREGDINGALIASADTWSFICRGLGVPKIPLFGAAELHKFLDIIESAEPTVKYK